MTTFQSTTRLIIYVLIAMLTSASAGLMTVDFTDKKQVAAFTISVLTTGLVTARSYIDKSPSQVEPKTSQP